jgi:cell division protein FtsN
MGHFDRGVYEPGDDMRVFDGAEDDEDVEGSRLPLLIVLALLVLAMFAGVVWLAYTQGVARGRTETPVLTAENGPARVAPQNPGGVEQPYKGFKIYEQPAPPDDDVDAATTPSMPAAAAAKPAPVTATPAPPKPVAAAPKPLSATPPVSAPKIAAATPAPQAAKPAPMKQAPVKQAPASAVSKSALQPPAPAKPASVPVGAANSAPRSLALNQPAAAPPVAAPAPAAASGSYVLQIGAYKSQAEADSAWTVYKGRHAALLSGASSNVQQADLGEKGTWYRLRITGFPSKDVASAMCDRLKADGGSCFLAK